MVCSDCHSPHPTKSDAKKADIQKQMCVTCHADVAGPFVYEHDPVTGWSGDGCVECHKPHGSHAVNVTLTRLPRTMQDRPASPLAVIPHRTAPTQARIFLGR
jgi:predicted CXXCH cytochrome family protein